MSNSAHRRLIWNEGLHKTTGRTDGIHFIAIARLRHAAKKQPIVAKWHQKDLKFA